MHHLIFPQPIAHVSLSHRDRLCLLIFVTEPPVSSLVALPIQLFSRLTCASRAALSPKSLLGMSCLAWQMNYLSRQPTPSATGRPPYWAKTSSVTPVDSRVMASRIRNHNTIWVLVGTDRVEWSDQAGICIRLPHPHLHLTAPWFRVRIPGSTLVREFTIFLEQKAALLKKIIT